MDEAILMVLKMVEEGKITADEGARLIEKLKVKGEEPKSRRAESVPAEGDGPCCDWEDIGHDIEDRVHRKVRDHLDQVFVKVKGIGGGKKAKIISNLDLSGTVGGILDNVFSFVDQKLSDVYEEYEFKEKVTFHEEIDAGDVRRLEIHNFSGDISCERCEGTVIRVEGIKYGGGDSEEAARRRAEDTKIDVVTGGAGVRISASNPDNKRIRVDYFIKLPPGIEFDAHSVKGNVSIDGLDSKCEVKVVNGDLKIANSSREMQAKVVHGNIDVRGMEGRMKIKGVNADFEGERLAGAMFLKTVNGDIQVKESSGELEIETLSGDIRLCAHKGRLYCKSASGDIECRDIDTTDLSCTTKSGDVSIAFARFDEGVVEVKSMSGDVTVRVPSVASSHFRGKTVNGDMSVDAPSAQVERPSENRFEVCFGEGKGRGAIATTSGDITITEKNSPESS